MCHVDPSAKPSVDNSTGIGNDNGTDAGSSGTGSGLKLSNKPTQEPASGLKASSKPEVQNAYDKAANEVTNPPANRGPLKVGKGVFGTAQSDATFEARGYGIKHGGVSQGSTGAAVNSVVSTNEGVQNLMPGGEAKAKKIGEIAAERKKDHVKGAGFAKACWENVKWAVMSFLGLFGFGVGSSEAGKSTHATAHDGAVEVNKKPADESNKNDGDVGETLGDAEAVRQVFANMPEPDKIWFWVMGQVSNPEENKARVELYQQGNSNRAPKL